MQAETDMCGFRPECASAATDERVPMEVARLVPPRSERLLRLEQLSDWSIASDMAAAVIAIATRTSAVPVTLPKHPEVRVSMMRT